MIQITEASTTVLSFLALALLSTLAVVASIGLEKRPFLSFLPGLTRLDASQLICQTSALELSLVLAARVPRGFFLFQLGTRGLKNLFYYHQVFFSLYFRQEPPPPLFNTTRT